MYERTVVFEWFNVKLKVFLILNYSIKLTHHKSKRSLVEMVVVCGKVVKSVHRIAKWSGLVLIDDVLSAENSLDIRQRQSVEQNNYSP